MDIEKIPNSFWYSLSFAIVSLTVGFLIISYQSGSVTLKFKELEVKTKDVAALEKNIQKQQEIISLKEKEIEDLKVILDKKLEELNIVKNKLAELQRGSSMPETREAITTLVSEIEGINRNFDMKIQEKQENLNILQQRQEVYKQQQEMLGE
ncbi:hypothetical protein PM10SUCC1_00090 [Propionigenium maris DSM 9537]|uniref:Uncharacterized protein n=1 Tax=Propionigenium maris DSM 9537 TaxID=1123000 RepID=A0A9W6GIG4_9FUSO|nr:hypothetical protein [Propionigenium maris]GLI54494.1 hypothetical protein PM10SUCC1_00090 [Propionigenium maris DSM 9537]